MISRTSATWMGIASILQWALLPVLAKLAGEIPPFQITGLAFGVASLFVLGYWGWQRVPVAAQFRLPLPLLGLGLWGLFGFHFCYFLALQKAPPVDAFLIIELWPLLILLFAVPLAGEKLAWYQLAGAVAGFAGVVLVALGKGDFAGFSPEYLQGYGLAAVAAVTWALYSVLSRRYATFMTANAIGVFCILSAAFSLLSHVIFETWVQLSGFQWLMVMLMGLGPVGAAFFTWNIGMKHGNIQLLGVLSLAVPLLGTLGLIVFGFGEFTRNAAVATLLVVLGGVLGSGFWKKA